MKDGRVAEIHRRLEAAFGPRELRIEDQSHLHAGHAGARESGGGHFAVTIVAQAFAGRTPVQRHRMVYDVLRDLMPEEIHALSIRASTPAAGTRIREGT